MGKKKKQKKRAGEYYGIKDNDIKAKNRFCPKCGEGTFLAEHKDRVSCGKCGYTEWKQK